MVTMLAIEAGVSRCVEPVGKVWKVGLVQFGTR